MLILVQSVIEYPADVAGKLAKLKCTEVPDLRVGTRKKVHEFVHLECNPILGPRSGTCCY